MLETRASVLEDFTVAGNVTASVTAHDLQRAKKRERE